MKSAFTGAVIYPDGTSTLRPVRSVFDTPEERAADYLRKAHVAMDDDRMDDAGIYFAWAEYEKRLIP